MLPDYPQTKQLIAKAFGERLELARQQRLGIFSEVRVTKLHEGARCLMHREDGSTADIGMENLSASSTVKSPDPSKPLSANQVRELAESLGKGMAEEQIRMMIGGIDQAAEEVGNVTTPGARMVEQIIESTELVELDFDSTGRPVRQVAMFGSEEMVARFHEAMKEIENDPELRRRYEAARSRQWEKWCDRENSRKLVE